MITQQEQPVVRISPYSPEPGENDNPLKNSIVFEKDIVAPMGEFWEDFTRHSCLDLVDNRICTFIRESSTSHCTS